MTIAKSFRPRKVVARAKAVLRQVPDVAFTAAEHLHFPGLISISLTIPRSLRGSDDSVNGQRDGAIVVSGGQAGAHIYA